MQRAPPIGRPVTQRLIIRQEMLGARPALLLVIEYDAELGTAECDASELRRAVCQVLDYAATLRNIQCRVFSSALIDGRRNFIEWSEAGGELVEGRRAPDQLPPSLLSAELLNQSLMQYGAHSELDAAPC